MMVSRLAFGWEAMQQEVSAIAPEKISIVLPPQCLAMSGLEGVFLWLCALDICTLGLYFLARAWHGSLRFAFAYMAW